MLSLRLTAAAPYRLRIEMTDADGNFRLAEYDSFSLGGAYYNLTLSGFRGTAATADGSQENEWGLRSDLSLMEGAPFSTLDSSISAPYETCAHDLSLAGWSEMFYTHFLHFPSKNVFLSSRFVPDIECVIVNFFTSQNNNTRTANSKWDGLVWPSFESAANSLQSLVLMVQPQSKLKKVAEKMSCE